MALASFLNKVTSNISSLAGSDPQYVVRAFSSQAEMGVDASRSFAKNCFLMAHNAAASKANGFVYFQQELSITELLNMGVRGLNLDVRLDNGTVFLVHGSMNETRAQMAGASPPPALSAFSEVAAWLAAHPSETVLILLESYVPDAQVLPPLLEQSGLALLVFYADGRDGFWNVEEKGWPTVQQMVDAGKRCVILSGAKEDGMPYEYWYAAENHFGDKSLNPATWAQPRWTTAPITSNPNFLLVLNRFPDADATPLENVHHNGAKRNDSNAVVEMVHDVSKQLAGQGVTKLPNFLNVDMVNHGTNGGVGEAVRRINEELWSKA